MGINLHRHLCRFFSPEGAGGLAGWFGGGVYSGQGRQTASLYFSLSFLFLSLFVSNLSLFFSNLRKRKEKGKEKRKEKKERERKRKERDRKRKENSTESGALPVRTLVSPVRSRSPLPQKLFALQSQGDVKALFLFFHFSKVKICRIP